MASVEIRIHGVSGTPPDTMLNTDPVVIGHRLDGKVQIYAPVRQDPALRAYRWSSLTSGTALSALWILLLPFMLANLAGFALPRLSRARERVAAMLVRTAGLILTVIFSLITAQGFIDVGAYQYLFFERRVLGATESIALGSLTAMTVLLLIWVRLSTREAGAVESTEDPVGRYRLSDPGLWRRHLVEDELRLLHLAAAVLAVGWVTIDGLDHIGWKVPLPLESVLLVVLPIAGFVTFCMASTGRATATAPRTIAYLAAGILIVLVFAAAWSDLDGNLPAELSLHSHPMSITVTAYAVMVIGLLAFNLAQSDRRNAITAPALLTIAGATGASVGAALIQVSATATTGIRPHWIANLAEGYLTGGLVVLAVTLGIGFTLIDPAEASPTARLWKAVRRLRDRLEGVMWAILVTTATLAIGFIGGRFGWWAFGVPAIIPTVIAAVDLGLATVWLLRLGHRRSALLLLGVFLIMLLAASRGILDRAGAFGWSFSGYTATATSVTILIPLVVIGAKVFGSVRNSDQRRGLAVLWDVGSFFPPWHHPFAPPAYGAMAVKDLAEFIDLKSQSDDGVIVAAHSQGSVLAVAAMALHDRLPEDIALLTFGSPVGSLYRRFFPNLFDDLHSLSTALGPRWINLYRNSDPIGGPIGSGMDRPPLEDRANRVHGGYWLETAYGNSIAELRSLTAQEHR